MKKDNSVDAYHRQQQRKAIEAQQETQEFERVKALVLTGLTSRIGRLRGDGVPVNTDWSDTPDAWITHNTVRTLRIQFIALHRRITFVKDVGTPFHQTIVIKPPANEHLISESSVGAITDDGINALVDKAVNAAIDLSPEDR